MLYPILLELDNDSCDLVIVLLLKESFHMLAGLNWCQLRGRIWTFVYSTVPYRSSILSSSTKHLVWPMSHIVISASHLLVFDPLRPNIYTVPQIDFCRAGYFGGWFDMKCLLTCSYHISAPRWKQYPPSYFPCYCAFTKTVNIVLR